MGVAPLVDPMPRRRSQFGGLHPRQDALKLITDGEHQTLTTVAFGDDVGGPGPCQELVEVDPGQNPLDRSESGRRVEPLVATTWNPVSASRSRGLRSSRRPSHP
jgi:hypothetical protein